MTSTRNRRWFQYSLRTLFVVVTVLGTFIGWNLHRVGQRQRMLRDIQLRGGWYSDQSIPAGPKAFVPTAWLLFGAEPVGILTLPPDALTEEHRVADFLFPEALIQQLDAEDFSEELRD